jgi:eukaryotic-like serine/threonine-protein kinase
MSDEERLADLLLVWEEKFEQGVDIPCDQLCQNTPDLVNALAERIADLKRMNWLDSQAPDRSAPANHRGDVSGDSLNPA